MPHARPPSSCQYAQAFVPNATITPPLPVVVRNMSETGDTLVPLRSSLRSQYAWPAAQQAAGKKLIHKGYEGQQHALCCIPQGGQCFYDVISLLKNGTFPAPSPMVSEASFAEKTEEFDKFIGRNLFTSQ